MRHPPRLLFLSAALGLLAWPADAQERARQAERERAEARERRPLIVGMGDLHEDDARAVLGIGTSSSGERDTLGLLITSVTSGGPAEKAGLEEGNRIVEVNGVSLRLAAADAGESDMRGMTSRRLTRELRKVNPGDEVTLRVWDDGQMKTVRVKTVAAEDLPGRRRRLSGDEAREARQSRAVLGLSMSSTGSTRDTLGVFVSRVVSGGPAERAGITEGARVAAINGVDLTVSREDAGDPWVSNAMINRFQRAMRDVKPEQNVELRVYSAGRYNTVQVRAGRAGDVYKDERGFAFHIGEMADAVMPALAPLPPIPPLPPMEFEFRSPGDHFDHFDHFDREIGPEVRARILEEVDRARAAAEQLRERVRVRAPDRERQMQEPGRASAPGRARAAAALAPAPAPAYAAVAVGGAPVALAPAAAQAAGPASASLFGRGTLGVPGLRLTPVSDDLAAYLGEGSEQGLLVLEADDRWDALREGDVILSINGRPVRAGERWSIAFDEDGDETVVVLLRKGERRVVTFSGPLEGRP